METRKLAIVLGAVCVLAAVSHAATGWVEDFNDNNSADWFGTAYYHLTEANQELEIVANKQNGSWNSFWYDIYPTVIDMSANPRVTVRVKADTDLNLNFSLWDVYNSNKYPVTLETGGLEITASDDYQTYCFNFAGVSGINLTQIYKLNFVFNAGTPTYRGTVYFDDLRIGSEAALTPNITNVPTQQHIINAPQQWIPLRGISANGGGSPITINAVSSNPGLIPDPCVIYTSPASTGYLRYTPQADQYGTCTITVTVSAPGTQPVTMAFDVVVEKNMAPRIDQITDQKAKAGVLRTIELTGIDDGNPNARQTIVVTAESSNPSLIPHPTVVYASDDFAGSLRLTPSLGQTGTATITVTVQDNGGTVAGGADTNQIFFDVSVYEQLNLPPTINELPDFSILRNDNEQVIVMSGIGDGDADVNQNLTVVASSSDTNLVPTPVIQYTSPDSSGLLRFTPCPNQIGNATVIVTVTDDGGLPNNNGNESTEIAFDVQVRVRPIIGFEDEFTDGILDPCWNANIEGAHTVTEEGGALKIVVDKVPTGNIWAGLWYPIPNELDISEHPYISIRMRTTNPNDMLIFLWDYQDHYNTAGTVTQNVTSTYVEYYFDFTGKTKQGDGQDVDISRLKALLFNFDPGGTPLYQGTFYFDDLRVGDKVHRPPVTPVVTINSVPDYAVARNSPQQTVELSGISDGNNNAHQVTLAVQSSNTSVIPTPVASTVVNGNATLTYTPAPNVTGSSTITVTASASGSTSKQVSFKIDVVTVDVPSAVGADVNLATHYQEIDGFGAFLGGGVDVLIPYVEDIGMTMARFGVIDAEFEPSNDNSDPNITDLDAFNYSALPMEFMRHLKEQTEVEKFIVTMWSPPAWMKKNKCLSAESWATDNILQPHFYNEYGESMVALVKAVKKEAGIDLYAVSLQNEPQFNEPYASCVITWEPYRDLLKVVGPRFDADSNATKIFFPEALHAQGSIDDYIHTVNADLLARNHVDVAAVHNYDSDGINVGGPGAQGWTDIYSWAQEPPAKKTWMTETSGHADNWDGAMTLAANIYQALYYGKASAWVFWSFNVSTGSEVFGLMVNTVPTSRYYVSKQYYKFIKPGAYRVGATSANSDILVLAFHHQVDNTVTVLLINKGTVPRVVNVTGSGLPSMYASYTTSNYRNCVQGLYVTDGLFLMPASSVATLYGTIAPPGPPAQASAPNPGSGATGVGINADLSWSAGAGATSHDIYLGTDANAVAAADHNDPEFKVNQAGVVYDPGLLAAGVAYYWRIDEVNPYGTTLGSVWNFTTQSPIPPGQASNPAPANHATGIGWDADLSWTAGASTESHDVYFGTTSTPAFIGNQSGTGYEPGRLAAGVTYYWRIDEKNMFGTTVGVVWDFTTLGPTPPGQATNPSPANGATGVSTSADLSWTAGALADSHDVHFGTTNPPALIGNQTATTYDPGTLAYSMTYYWRIDEKNAYGTTQGAVWQFTVQDTPPPPPGQLLVWDFIGDGGNLSAPADLFDPHISNVSPSGVASIGAGLEPLYSGYFANGLTAQSLHANSLAEALANNEYFTWTITPQGGYQMSLASVDIRPMSQNNTRTFALLSSVNGFTESAVLGSFTHNGTGGATLQTINLTGHNNLTSPVEFRLYVYPSISVYECIGIGNYDGNDLIVNGSTSPTGPVPPGQASAPSPANGAISVDRLSDLSWTAGYAATSHDVYFGFDPTPDGEEFQGNQSGTTFDPGILAPNSTYYWRIDEKNAYGTTQGSVWSFTTVAGQPIQLDAVYTGKDADAGGTSLSFNHTIGDGNDRALIVGIGAEDTSTADVVITGVTYNGVPMTPVPNSTASTGTSYVIESALYYMLNSQLPAPGAYTVSITFAGAVDDRSAGAISLFNVEQSPPEAAATNVAADPGSTVISTNITTLTDGAWVIDAVASGDAGTFSTTASGMLERYDISADSSNTAGATKPAATAGQTTMSWSHNTQKRMAHSLVAFAPAQVTYLLGDLDVDGDVDTDDLDIFADQWLDTGGCSTANCADLGGDNLVNFEDLALLGANWGK